MSQFRWNWYTEIYTKQLNVESYIPATTYYPASTGFIDVSAFERVCFTLHAGAIDSALTCQVYQDTSATKTSATKVVTGATVTIGTGDDNEDFSIEIDTSVLDTANGFVYLTLYITGAAGTNDYAAIVFHGYAARGKPVTQPASFPTANHASIVVG